MFGQLTLPLGSDWDAFEGYIPMSFHGRRFHPLSLAPEELLEGGCFDYGRAPSIFLGRRGWGPLRVAWDTNILIDWRDFGSILLEDDAALRPGLDAKHSEDLVALGAIMNLIWMTRDIRIRPLSKQRCDFRRDDSSNADTRRIKRERQLDEIASALICVGLGEPTEDEVFSTVDWKVPFIEQPADRALVEEALASGSHVFLTRDARILRHAQRLWALGLRVQRPSELLDDLLFADEFHRPFGPDGLACDSHKWHHVWKAIGRPAA